MKRLQVLVVARRYWPHSDDACQRLASLVEGLRRQGIFPTVLAPRYDSSWPQSLMHREIPVLRPLVAPRGDWSMGRYLRALGRWLDENLRRFDAVYCDTMREDAAAVVAIARKFDKPSVVRCGTLAGQADFAWQASGKGPSKTFVRCLAADAIIAPRATSQQSLLAAGASPPRIVRITDGIPPPIRRTQADRKASREALAHINSDLCVPIDGCVVLCMNRLAPGTGVMTLAQSMAPLLEQRRRLRLWMIGDGVWRSKIDSELKHSGVRCQAFLPGSFDHIDALLHSVDMFVLPSAGDGTEHFWPAAIAAGLPSAVVDCAETRAVLGADFSELASFPADDRNELRLSIAGVIHDLDSAQQTAERIRSRQMLAMPLSDTIARYADLLRRLVGSSSGNSRHF